VIAVKKIFYILVFFIIAGGIFYIAENINPKNGVTLRELSQLVNGNTKKNEEEIEKGLENIKDENMLEEDKFSPFISIGKSLTGGVKKLYDNILVSNYNRDNLKFIKLASGLKSEELIKLFQTLKEQNIDVSSIIEDIQNTLKDNSLTNEQRDKLSELIKQIK
jgi:phosphoribosylanthranilate isomerase